MTLAISTSSPIISVALFDSIDLRGSKREQSNRNASELVIRLTDELLGIEKIPLSMIERIVVDRGPGSFTGVKVGVTIAKIWSQAINAELFGIDSFDLISLTGTVFVPHKRNAFVIRPAGQLPFPSDLAPESSAIGYGIEELESVFPDAGNAQFARSQWIRSTANALVPNYIVEPSISQPRRVFRSAESS